MLLKMLIDKRPHEGGIGLWSEHEDFSRIDFIIPFFIVFVNSFFAIFT